ncbi:methyltransferase domain-containing protein [Polymorphospora sp. NPDC051019]|uniref:class I SAM-dependent methyltransferase n=1 Tax=Polymorphospora sp. NPDC051019 TaxID=3155725 RepID=UPI00341C3E40
MRGTGRLALRLAAAGHRVTGADPAHASLAAARAKPGADRVTWIEGTAAVLPRRAFDVAVMTSHVAQFLVTDAQWRDTIGAVAGALVPGGRLLFDSRDPAAREWERWNPVDFRRRVSLPDGSRVGIWTEVTAVRDGVVSFTRHYTLPHAVLRSTATLRFRTEDELRSTLEAAGLVVERVHGGWERQPVGAGDGEFIVVARRSAGSRNGDRRGRWVVWRQDDNGNRYEVARRELRADADDLAAAMEARGHKQTYWVAAADRPG